MDVGRGEPMWGGEERPNVSKMSSAPSARRDSVHLGQARAREDARDGGDRGQSRLVATRCIDGPVGDRRRGARSPGWSNPLLRPWVSRGSDLSAGSGGRLSPRRLCRMLSDQATDHPPTRSAPFSTTRLSSGARGRMMGWIARYPVPWFVRRVQGDRMRESSGPGSAGSRAFC